jgi:hypothetical protein
MSERPHFIQLAPDEDATSVRDRLSFIRGKRVLLVWPEEGTVLQRKLDLVLIQREAIRRAVRLALVTHDPLVVKHADELNISTFRTIGESERKRWRRGKRGQVFTSRHQKPDEAPLPDDIEEVASRTRHESASPSMTTTITRWVLGIVFSFAGVAAVYAFVPSATITLTPARTLETVTVEVRAEGAVTDLDIENRIMPLTRLRVEIVENGTVEATGTVALTDTRAAGTIVLINRTAETLEVPAGTVVSTSAGNPIRFRTTETITLTAEDGQQGEVPIEALQDFAGEIGNVSEGLINTIAGNLSGSVEVRNVTPTSGGSSQNARALTQADLDRLETTVRQQIQSQAFNEMQPLITSSQFIILETLVIAEERDDWKTFSASTGDIAETATLNMRAVVEASAVDEQFGRQIAFAALSSRVPRGRVLQPEAINYNRGAASLLNNNGDVAFEMTATAVVAEPVDEIMLRRELANQRPDVALSYLLTEIDTHPGTIPDMRLSPGWMRRLPILPTRINIQVEEAPL